MTYYRVDVLPAKESYLAPQGHEEGITENVQGFWDVMWCQLIVSDVLNYCVAVSFRARQSAERYKTTSIRLASLSTPCRRLCHDTRVVPKVMSKFFFLHANWEQQTKDSAVVDGTSCCVILECLVTSIACITWLLSLLTKWPITICRFASVLS